MTLLSPRKKDIRMLGLGYSVGTTNDGITADAIVVRSFAELKRRADEVKFNFTILLLNLFHSSHLASVGEKLLFHIT